jgi:hypothetical protein
MQPGLSVSLIVCFSFKLTHLKAQTDQSYENLFKIVQYDGTAVDLLIETANKSE